MIIIMNSKENISQNSNTIGTNKSWKQFKLIKKMKFDKYYIFCISIIKSLKKFTKIWSRHYNYGKNMILIWDLKTFCFNFHWPKEVDENLKRKIEFMIKSNESLAGNKIKTRLHNYLWSISIETIFMNKENSKVNESHKCILNCHKN